MKKLLLLTTLASLFLFSCKKEHGSSLKPAQKMYKVTFDMASGFSQSINSLKSGKLQVNGLAVDSATANLSAYTSVLQLLIFDSTGNLVRKFQQIPSVSNYGIIVDSLAAGTYTVVVDAGQTNLSMFSIANGNAITLNGTHIYYKGGPVLSSQDPRSNENLWSDTFLSKFQLTVTNAAVNQDVTLSRIVGKLEVDFNDMIPANAARVDMFLNKEDFTYLPGTMVVGTPDTVTTHFIVPDSVKGTSNYKFSQIVLNTSTPFSVTLTAYDSANHIIATHAVSNVSCEQNKRTVLSGNFSNTSTPPGFTITLNPAWNTPTVIHY